MADKTRKFLHVAVILSVASLLCSMCSKHVCRVSVEQGELYLLTTLWEEGAAGLDLAVTDSQQAWTGSVSEESLGGRAKKMKMDFDDYVTETKKALTRENVGNLNFEYSLRKEGSAFCFSWKKFMAKDKIKIQLGQCTLSAEAEASDVLRTVLEQSIAESVRAQEKIQVLTTDNQRLGADRSTAIKRLEKAVTAKSDMEHDLYTKFVEVINNKKKKIRELKEELESCETASPSSVGRSQYTASMCKVEPSARADALSDSEVEAHGSDYNTDEDVSVPSPSKKGKVTKSKVRQSTADPLDDSIELDMDGEDVPATANARRRGKRGVVKQTPSKAVIPKVPSSELKKTPGTRGRPPLVKKDSHSSNQSNLSRLSSDPDCEDLLADL